MAEDKGMGFFTGGKYKTWIGQGKTEVVAASNYTLTYGVKTSTFLGMTNDFTIGTKSAFFRGASFDAKKGTAFEITKASTLRVGAEGGFHYSDHHFASVGSSQAQKLLIEKARSAAWLLVDIQTASMVALSSAALIFKVDETQNADKANPHSSKDVFGYVASIATILTGLAVMLGILNKRFNRYCKTDTPVGLLSMQSAATGSVFLGTRDSTGRSSAGVAMNKTGIELSTAEADLEYRKAGTATIGFKKKPDAGPVAGARLKLNAKGDIEAWATDMALTLKGNATHKASKHDLTIIDDQGGDTECYLRMDASGAAIQADNTTGFFVDSDTGCYLATDQSSLFLTKNSSQLSQGSGTLRIEDNKVTLELGGTEIKIDPSGINLGAGALTIMTPRGSSSTLGASDLAKIKKHLSKTRTTRKSEGMKLKTKQKKLKLEDESVDLSQAAIISASVIPDDPQA
ncbi:hypothetical protein [Castellaniella sp. GW247-6E4]|uniref:hypothetical protein n=1 Tax=Castellaniella sp. GW247-6E4 TaxID=3140380 RepID=UPI003314F5CE